MHVLSLAITTSIYSRDRDDEDGPDLDLFTVHDSDNMSDVDSVVSWRSASNQEENFEEDHSGPAENMAEEPEEIPKVAVESLRLKLTIIQEEASKIKKNLQEIKSASRRALEELSKSEVRRAKAQGQKRVFCANARNDVGAAAFSLQVPMLTQYSTPFIVFVRRTEGGLASWSSGDGSGSCRAEGS